MGVIEIFGGVIEMFVGVIDGEFVNESLADETAVGPPINFTYDFGNQPV